MRLCEIEGFMGHKEQAALRVRRYQTRNADYKAIKEKAERDESNG
jgi:hypothetical protein